MGVESGFERAPEPPAYTRCLSTDDVLAHLAGRLAGAASEAVREHLDACGACRVLMAEAARSSMCGARGRSVPRTLSDGERVAERYEIRRFIASGGMGEVYEAADLALGETVALKTLIITATDQADAVDRLLAEVRTARRVTDLRVCRILEFGVHRRSQRSTEVIPFLTMPLLEGETLAAHLSQKGRLDADEARRLLLELATGLDAVHQAGIVHRDFKSENVFLVRRDDGVNRAVVMDFGLARALDRREGERGSANGILLGTPAYMAPEQLTGGDVSIAADVYAFGVVAYEALTGRLPKRGVSPPSCLGLGFAKAWDLLIRRCLEHDPRRRFATMGEIVEALERLRTAARRRRTGWPAALALGTAVAALGVVTASWPVRQSQSGSSVAPDLASAAVAPLRLSVPESAPRRDEASERTAPPATRRSQRTKPARPASVVPVAPVITRAATPDDSVVFEPPAPSRPRHPDDLVDPF